MQLMLQSRAGPSPKNPAFFAYCPSLAQEQQVRVMQEVFDVRWDALDAHLERRVASIG